MIGRPSQEAKKERRGNEKKGENDFLNVGVLSGLPSSDPLNVYKKKKKKINYELFLFFLLFVGIPFFHSHFVQGNLSLLSLKKIKKKLFKDSNWG